MPESAMLLGTRLTPSLLGMDHKVLRYEGIAGYSDFNRYLQ